jgi:hypothetical protein
MLPSDLFQLKFFIYFAALLCLLLSLQESHIKKQGFGKKLIKIMEYRTTGGGLKRLKSNSQD